MIEVVEETGSTNADLLARLQAGEAVQEGFWLRAERQSAGRGRSGQQWLSDPGNLYTSTIVNLRDDDPPAHTLSLVTGIAVYEMLKGQLTQAADVFLKWPNDVLVRNAKIAGILLERSGSNVVVGIGVNVLTAPTVEGRETTAIADENGRNQNGPDAVLGYLAKEMAHALSQWRCDGLTTLFDRWTQRAFPIGTRLSVHEGADSQVHGFFEGLDSNGALVLRLANGAMRTIHAGDVSLMTEGKR